MPDSTLILLSFRIPIYSLALALGIAVSLGITLRRTTFRPAFLVDACLGTCLGGILGARLEHVLLNWNYFADNLGEALRPSAGGLGWHGALLGGLFGLALVARWRSLNFRALLDALAPALPLLAFAAWLGCWAAVCAYGAEVDTLAHYPGFAADETRDVYGIVAPRYNTQIFGMVLAFALFLLSLFLIQRGWLPQRRFWLLLTLLSLSMFVISFFRGDFSPTIAALQVDQYLDITFALWSIALTLYNRRREQ
jgi:phosphatidylglycerol:prolipoprotein diacylglycerol transferase